MSEQSKYSDQRGQKHDSMTGAQWADEAYERKAKKPSNIDEDVIKVIVFLGFVYVCTAFVAVAKIFRAIAPEFSRGTPGAVTMFVFFAVSVIAFLVGMTKCKSSLTILAYSIAGVGFTSAVCFMLPALVR